MTSVSNHECEFPEVTVTAGDYDADDPLQVGMKVLAPCACGEPPLDEMQHLSSLVIDLTAAWVAALPATPLFHWSPASRRKQIERYGLRPSMRVTTSSPGAGPTVSFPIICLADSPSWAWALSGAMRWTPSGEWDLWQTDLGRLAEPVIIPGPDRLSGIYEVRTRARVYKRDLWRVGSRTKEGS